MCRFAVIDQRSRGYNFIYDSHLNLTYLKFVQGFQAASAQAQFYTQRKKNILKHIMKTVNSFHKQNINISSSLLLRPFKTHANNSWGHTYMFVNHIGCCCSFPSQSPPRSLVKASQNPPAKLYLKTKRCIRLKLLVWREPPFILTHWRLKEIARDPFPNSLAFFGIFQRER